MSAAVLISPTETETLPRKRFTRQEVEHMHELGVFDGQRLELIDGDLIDKMGQNPPNASAIQLLLEWLVSFCGVARVRAQLALDVAAADRERNFPEPDIAVLAEYKREFRERHPFGTECLLAVEVSDSTLRADATTKRDLYARAGVPEYWVVDLKNRRIIVHRALSKGAYAHIFAVAENESIAIEAEPDRSINVNQLLP